MKILVIGSDRKVFDVNSAVSKRQKDYIGLSGLLSIVVFSLASLGLKKTNLLDRITVYPSNSRSRWLYIFDAIRTAIKLEKPDLVSAQDPFESGLAACFVAKYFGVPLHIQIHTDLMSPYFYSGSALNKIRYFISRFTIPRAKCIRVVSERIKKSLVDSGMVKDTAQIRVLPIYVDSDAIKSRPVTVDLHKKYPQFKTIILMASRLTREKNIELAINAVREVVKNNQDVGLVVVGEGPEEERLKLLTTNYSLQTNVVFESWNNDLASYYKTADLFLLTSNFDGYAMTIVEALSAGTPVVMSDVGCAGEVVINEQNGLIFPVSDTGAATSAIRRYLSDQEFRDRLRSNIKQMVLPEIDEASYLEKYRACWKDCLE